MRISFLVKCIRLSRQSAFFEGFSLQADCQKVARGQMHFSETSCLLLMKDACHNFHTHVSTNPFLHTVKFLKSY